MGKLEQDIAKMEQELAILQTKKADKDKGEKYVVGGMMMNLARREPDIARRMVGWFDSELNRNQDKERILEFNNELRGLLNMPEKILPKTVKKKTDDSVKQDSPDSQNPAS